MALDVETSNEPDRDDPTYKQMEMYFLAADANGITLDNIHQKHGQFLLDNDCMPHNLVDAMFNCYQTALEYFTRVEPSPFLSINYLRNYQPPLRSGRNHPENE